MNLRDISFDQGSLDSPPSPEYCKFTARKTLNIVGSLLSDRSLVSEKAIPPRRPLAAIMI